MIPLEVLAEVVVFEVEQDDLMLMLICEIYFLNFLVEVCEEIQDKSQKYKDEKI